MPTPSRYQSSVLLMSVILGVVGAIGSATQVQAASFTSFSRGLLPSYPWDRDSGNQAQISGDGSTVIGVRNTGQSYNAYRWSQSDGFQLIGGPFLRDDRLVLNYSASVEVNTDGSMVVGHKNGELFQWDNSNGSQPIDIANNRILATGASANLQTVVGASFSGATSGPVLLAEAVRWSSVGGMQGLGYLPGDTYSYALDASDDGATVVGGSDREAFRWTQLGGIQGLGYLPGSDSSAAVAISGDGLTIVGSTSSLLSTGRFNTAVRWTEAGGIQSLGDLPGGLFNSVSLGISRDGSAVVGSGNGANGDEAFLWTQSSGMQSVQSLLTIAGLDLTGWSLWSATDVSDDGRSIVGVGRNPNGGIDTWIARLDATPPPTAVPETTPITPLLAGLAALGISLRRDRNKLV